MPSRAPLWNGSFYRITDSDIYINLGGFAWNFGVSWDPSKADFKGVVTHELGHDLYLLDVYGGSCPPGPTMCGAVTIGGTFSLRSTEADDHAAADVVY